MDKYVTRAPTWKTMKYPATASGRAGYRNNFCGEAAGKPLKEKPRNQGTLSCKNLSQDVAIMEQKIDENTPPPPCIEKNNLSNLEIFLQNTSRTLESLHINTAMPDDETVQPTNFNDEEPTERCNTPKPNPFLERIQRDLNSPSANVRMRALNALRSPTKTTTYAAFDVPHEEQMIITAEERKTPPPPPTIQELMRNIVVYVEVRTGEDNRSAGVKKVISGMGARVNDKLLRDTTHVVFKDGLLSSYKKATNWNIPVVSILWIEACKNKLKICDPVDFKISNLDRYENPELYDKFKRQKSMQPDSECNRRVRVKNSTPNEIAPTTPTVEGGPKNTLSLSLSMPVSANKSKIGHYFKQIGSIGKTAAESPATQFLNRIDSNYTPTSNVTHRQKPNITSVSLCNLDGGKEINGGSTNEGDALSTPVAKDVKKLLRYDTIQTRRRSLVQSTLEATVNSMDRVTISQDSLPTTRTPTKAKERRNSMVPASKQFFSTLYEETATSGDGTINMDISTKVKFKQLDKRRTTYTNKTLDISESSPLSLKKNCNARRETLLTPVRIEEEPTTKQFYNDSVHSKINSVNMEAEKKLPVNEFLTPTSNFASSTLMEGYSTPVQTDYLLPTDTSALPVYSSTRKPGRRRTLFDVTMDVLSHRLQNINNSARRSIITGTALDDPDCRNELETRRNSIEEHKAKINSQLDGDNSDAQVESASSIVDAGHANVPTKKRKLFNPNESQFTTPVLTASAKRRRSLMPTVTPLPLTKLTGNTTKEGNRRRSTMDLGHKKNKTQSRKELNVVVPKEAGNTQKNSELAEGKKKLPFLVCTNMRKPQIEVIDEAIGKLGGFQLAPFVTAETSHLVSLEPRRTLNILRALARGLWILEYEWIVESMKAGKWLNEEQYQLRDFSRAVEICRAERQAFGNTYKCELFTSLGSFYISSLCVGPISKDNLGDLIVLCGGKIVERRIAARYIIGDQSRTFKDKICITPFWVLDSITQMKLLKFQKYQCSITLPIPEPISKPL